MRRHDRFEPALHQRAERNEILGGDRGERALVDRQVRVRIGGHVPMSGKVLADAGHPSGVQPVEESRGEMRDGIGVAMEGPVADHGAGAVVEIEHRREAEVDAMGAQLAGQHEAQPRRLARGAGHVALPELAQRAHRRYRGEAVAEALHAAALVIDGDEQLRRAQRADLGRQRLQLRRGLEVPREQYDAAGQRMDKARAVLGRQPGPLDAEEDGARAAGRIVGCRHAAASRSSAFICRTASRMPTNTERETIACPMWSSRTPGSAATGCTLK